MALSKHSYIQQPSTLYLSVLSQYIWNFGKSLILGTLLQLGLKRFEETARGGGNYLLLVSYFKLDLFEYRTKHVLYRSIRYKMSNFNIISFSAFLLQTTFKVIPKQKSSKIRYFIQASYQSKISKRAKNIQYTTIFFKVYEACCYWIEGSGKLNSSLDPYVPVAFHFRVLFGESYSL